MRRATDVFTGVALAIGSATLLIGWRFDANSAAAAARVAVGSQLIATRCGPIEYQKAVAGPPLLVVHGSGGGHDQGMAFVGALARHGIRVIAMSRSGYLRTPMPADASPAAQSDAHTCLLDALGIRRAAVNTVLDDILPVSSRAEGLRSDSALGKSLLPYALESIVAPTLIVSTRDDGYGTFASAQYTARRIVGARFMGFEHGGHAWVGHDAEIQAAIIELIRP